jgi:hypothetical protein
MKMRINSRKVRKILRRIWTPSKRIFETFCTQEAPKCIGMNATHITIYFNLENQTKFFSYTIFAVKKVNVGKNFKLGEFCLF